MVVGLAVPGARDRMGGTAALPPPTGKPLRRAGTRIRSIVRSGSRGKAKTGGRTVDRVRGVISRTGALGRIGEGKAEAEGVKAGNRKVVHGTTGGRKAIILAGRNGG